MRRHLALFVSAMALGACDGMVAVTFDPADPSTLIGEWTERPSETTRFATAFLDTDLPDFDRVEGALTVRGAVSADLGTVHLARRLPNGQALLQVNTGKRPEGNPYVGLNVTGGHVSVTELRTSSRVVYSAGEVEDPPAFTYDGGELVLRPTTLRADTGDEVRVGGTLYVATTRLRAGREHVLSTSSCAACADDDTVWVFGEDGAFLRRVRVTIPFGSRTEVRPGAWEILGPARISLRLYTDDDTAYALEGSGDNALLVSAGQTTEEDDLRAIEGEYLLPPGSLLSTRYRQAYPLER